MEIETLSPKQRQVLRWWCRGSDQRKKTGIICDGAVRSGKTACMGLSFFLWAMACFCDRQFVVSGKTIQSVRRNLLAELLPYLERLGFSVEEKVSKNLLVVSRGRVSNTFYLFGGKDEGSAALIQGMTLAGVFFDEVVLMPESFVMQATARCSVEGAKLWFSCNPEGPAHWFYKNWIQKAEERQLCYLHFTMADNPSLSEKTLQKYYNMYSGVFFQRFVLGEWVAAEGRVYDFFDESYVKPVPPGRFDQYAMSCDYGTRNPFSLGFWGRQGDIWYRLEEYYYDGREMGVSKTDSEYLREVDRLAAERRIDFIVVDPSAASFIACLEQGGYAVRRANNQVLDGIRTTAAALRQGELVICAPCEAALREFSMYCWDLRAGSDAVCKQFDHAMDEIRYFAMEVRQGGADSFFATGVAR